MSDAENSGACVSLLWGQIAAIAPLALWIATSDVGSTSAFEPPIDMWIEESWYGDVQLRAACAARDASPLPEDWRAKP